MKKLFCFDIDGTLRTTTDHQVPESTIKALNLLREKGHLLLVSTGRSVDSLKKLVKVGDVIEAEITKITEGENSDILLSRLNTLKKDNYLKFKENNPVETNVEAKVIRVIEGKRYILNNAVIDMFMSVKDLKTPLQKGDIVAVKLISYDDNKQNAYVSRYAVVREERQHAYEERQRGHEEYVAKKVA